MDVGTLMSEASLAEVGVLEVEETYDWVLLLVENEEGDDLTGVAIVQNSGIRDIAGNVKEGIVTEIAFEDFIEYK